MDRYDPYTDKFLRDTQYNILSTNLAEVGTDCISKKQACDAFNTNIDELVVSGKGNAYAVERYLNRVIDRIKQLPPIQPEIIYCKDCSKHNVSISKAPYPFKEYICPLIAFRGEAQGHEFDYQFCAYGKKREVTTNA